MVDICLLVEGSYPFVAGGVSSWLHALITNLPQFTFAVVHLGDKPDPDREMKYQLPANVVEFRQVFIGSVGLPTLVSTPPAPPQPAVNAERASRKKRGQRPSPALAPSTWQTLENFHQALHMEGDAEQPDLLSWLGRTDLHGMAEHSILYSKQGWQFLTDLYTQFAADKSFTDYFWTFRSTHLPIFALLEAEVPAAKVYHSVSLGFGGFLGALAKLRTGRPLLITEHGRYDREIELEIGRMFGDENELEYQPERRWNFFQQWWYDMFQFMIRMAYDQADKVITITSANTRNYWKYGVDPAKTQIIPNGIDTAKYRHLQRQSRGENAFTVALVGRVVPVKDIKTFIRAVKIASASIPHIHAFIIGPTDEDLAYFSECQQLVTMLDVAPLIEFTGQKRLDDYYPLLDVMVLTSLSEGQPLVILEGNCAGIPVVATDVGDCRKLLTGMSAEETATSAYTTEDAAFGPSGIITPAVSPDKTAQALITLYNNNNPTVRRRMGEAGRARVLRYYGKELLYQAYDALYHAYCEQPSARGH